MSTTTTEVTADPSIQRLVNHLVRLAGTPGGRPADRGTLAALRAWSRNASQHLAYAALADLFARSGIHATALEDPVWTAIPNLFAWHRRHDPKAGGLGRTLQSIAGSDRKNFDAHFRRLLACDGLPELIGLLPRYVRRAEASARAIDFVRLYWDLRRWGQSPESAREVKVRWAREYFTETANDRETEAS